MGENHIATALAYGGQGHDIIYGADDSATVVIYGDKDYGYGIGSSLTTGGKDKIYGGDNNASVTKEIAQHTQLCKPPFLQDFTKKLG